MSYRNFRHLFKHFTGLPPQQYHLELKLNHAKKLLTESRASIAEIASSVGFTNPFYFSRFFRQKTRRSPTQWRNQN